MGKIQDPLLSRFIIPEHAEMLIRWEEEKKLIPKPELADDGLEEFNRVIRSAQFSKEKVEIVWWKHIRNNGGEYEKTTGFIQSIDLVTKQLKILEDDGYQRIRLENIVRINIVS